MHGLQQLWCVGSEVVVHGFQSAGSRSVWQGLRCLVACEVFLGQGLNPCPPELAAGRDQQGSLPHMPLRVKAASMVRFQCPKDGPLDLPNCFLT